MMLVFFGFFFTETQIDQPTLDGNSFEKLNREDNNLLTKILTVEEVKETTWSCDGDKSMGLDGFNFQFFKSYQDILQTEVCS